MKYKLIAIDIDDTLISDHHDISEKDRSAIRRAIRAGVHVILASGRGFNGVLPYNEKLELSGYTICTGGGHIYDGTKSVFANYIDADIVRRLMEWAENRGIYYQVYPTGGYYYSKHTEWTDYYRRHCGYEGTLDVALSGREDILAAKIVFFDKPEQVAGYAAVLRSEFPALNIMTSSPSFLEIYDPGTSKGAALGYVEKKLGIACQEIIAIGDSEIDISMFEYAGVGAAVTDAAEYVKAAADYVCTSKSDWVAEVIDRFVV